MDHIDLIRHFYHVEQGRQVMDSTFGKVAYPSVDVVTMRRELEKVSVADPVLMKIALRLAGEGDALEMYERLGGTFKKEALGAPMFHPPSMPTAPSVAAPSAGGSAPKVPLAPKPQGSTFKQPAPKVPQSPQPQDSSQQVKVQLQSPGPGQQGTSVSIG
jgi:hypothetical protein